MKRSIAAVLVMAFVLLGAPWVIGNVAEERVNRGFDAMVEEAPYLGIVERNYTRGWFRSEQAVTFEVLGPVSRTLDPASVLVDALKKAAGPTTPAGAPIEATPGQPVRFTLRSEILHGPVLGFSSLGVARVNWRPVLDEKIRAKLVAIFGTDEPLRVSTRIGFFGGGTTSLEADPMKIRRRNGTGEVSWDNLQIDVEHSGDLDKLAIYGDWDRFEARDDLAKFSLGLRDMKLTGFGKRIAGRLYDADLDFKIGGISYTGPDRAVTSVKDLRYVADTKVDGDFVSFATRLGSGAIESGELAARGLKLQAMHYDVTVRRLHIATLEKFLAAIDASYAADAPAGATPETEGYELLEHDPEFVIDRVGIETSEGEAYLKGIVRLKGATEKDLKMGALSLLARLDADLHLEAPRKLIEKIDSGGESLAGALAGGYAELQGDKVASHVEFRGGELKVNGKVQGIPGLGAPPADEKAGPE